MKLACPSCQRTIPAKDIALATGWAKCEACDEVFQLAGLLEGYVAPGSLAAVPLERPFDAWTVVRRQDNLLVVHQGARGLRAATMGMLVFAAIWLSFITFWTLGALGIFFNKGQLQLENLWFAAFSIPFWLVGLCMLGGVVWLARGTRSVSIDAVRLTTELRCLAWRRTRTVERDEVQCAWLGTPMVRNEGQAPIPYVEIVYSRGSFKLPADSDAERAWLIAEINDFLQRVPYDPAQRDMLDQRFDGARLEFPADR